MADEAAKNAKIEEMLVLTKADALIHQVFEQMKGMQQSEIAKLDLPTEAQPTVKEYQDKIFALMQDRMSWTKLKPAYIKIYGDTFSEEEISGIVDFYKSPVGRAMLEKMPMLVQKSITVAQAQLGEIMPEIRRLTKEMMEQAKKTEVKK